MRRLLLFAALLLALPAHAERFAWINGSLVASTSNGYTQAAGGRVGLVSTESQAACPMPDAGKILEMVVKLRIAPGVGTSRTFSAMLNGSASAMSVSYASGESGIKRYSTALAFAQHDRLSFEAAVSGSPPNSRVEYYFLVDGVTAGESYLCGTTLNNLINIPDNTSLNGGNNNYCGGVLADCATVISTAGRVRKLRALMSVAPGAGESCTFTYRDFGSDTALTCTISGATDTSCSDTTSDVTVAAGNPTDLNIDCTVGVIVAAPRFQYAVAFKSSVPGRFLIPFSPRNNPFPTGTTNYALAHSAADGLTTTETQHQGISPPLLVKGLSAYSGSSPGVAKGYVITLRDDAAASSATGTLSGTNTSFASSSEATIAADSLVGTEVAPFNTPTALRMAITYTGRIAPDVVQVLEQE